MILVMGTIKAGAGEVARLKEALSAQVAATRGEEGCEHYSFAIDGDDPDLVHIAERWASEEALAAQGQSPHMKTFNRAVGGAKLERVVVKAWRGEHWRDLIG